MPRTDALGAGRGSLATLLRPVVPELLRQLGVPGASLATIEERRPCWQAGFGLARMQPPRPALAETVYEAASLSKPVFAYAVLGLCARGLLDLDAPLVGYLPGLFPAGDERLGRVSARHVLCHVGGFANWTRGGDAESARFEPGSRYSYSSKSHEYLQAVVESITGRPLAEYLRREVLLPVAMSGSAFVWEERFEPLVAIGHDSALAPRAKGRPAVGNAGGTLHCTATDFARFVSRVLWPADDESGLLPEAWRREMLRPQVQVNDDGVSWLEGWPRAEVTCLDELAWGLGWGLQDSTAGRSIWHWGDNDGFKSFAIAHVGSGQGLVVMTNGDRGLLLADALASLCFGARQPAMRWLGSFYGF